MTPADRSPHSVPPFVVLFGPTASGKSAAVQVLHHELSRHGVDIELLSADSMQVYRGMDIGTAKPGAAERAAFPHHLLDIRNPDEPFTAGDFVAEAESAMRAVAARGALPVVAGGTAFYIRSLLCGLPEAPASEVEVRRSLEAELVDRGADALRKELERVDPSSAARISHADHYRLVRALEVYRCTGRPRSSFAVSTQLRPDLRVCCLALDRSRSELYRRIDARVEQMVDAGLEAEVRSLVEAGYRPSDPGMRAIGYREFCALSPDASGAERIERGGLHRADTVMPAIKRNTRRYAKRQITFFRSFSFAEWLPADDSALLIERVRRFLSDDRVSTG